MKVTSSSRYRAAPISMEPTTASGTSRLGLRASPASWAACSKPSRAKITPSGRATNTPLMPNGMKPPPAVKFELWNDLDMMKMMVITGTAIFQIIMMLLLSDIHLTPSRFSPVNRNIPSTATTRPLPVSRPEEFSRPCHHLAFK